MGRETNYDKMTGSDWRRLLEEQPELADKCDWSKLDGYNWSALLQKQPQFADKCDWSKLFFRYWCWLLCKQPQFADKCDCWDDFGTDEWIILLSEQPQFADKCDKWDEFEIGDVYSDDWGGGNLDLFDWGWIELLRHQPQFADKIDWSKFSQEDRDNLEEGLEFAAKLDAGEYDEAIQDGVPWFPDEESDEDESDEEDGDDEEDGNEEDDDEEEGDEEDGPLMVADFLSAFGEDGDEEDGDDKTVEKKAPKKRKARTVEPAVVEGIIASMVPIPGKDYRMGKFQVTQEQWEAVTGKNPSKFKGAENPVEFVSWKDCQAFLKKLNATPVAKASGLVFRLPEEDEWEYACRAGATGKYCNLADGTEITEETLGEVAWFKDNSERRTHPVGQKKPNAFGLYDMSGNVAEWTASAVGMYRVCRGGGWGVSARYCESSDRDWGSPGARRDFLGFRLCASGS